MGRLLPLVILLVFTVGSAAAETKERAAIISIELGKGVQEFLRAKAATQVSQGLIAAGYDVVPSDQVGKKLTGDLASCKAGACLAQVAKAVDATSLVTVSITRKHDSTIIVMRMLDPQSGDAVADIHEVCDLCGQDELEERIGVAASALRAKAAAERAKRGNVAAPTTGPAPPSGGPVKVAVVPGIAVNLDTARVDALSQDLAEALQAELVVEAIGGLEVRRKLPPDGVPADCVTNAACTADVARRTGANQLLFVVMVDTGSGGAIQIDTTWVEPASNRNASRPAIDLANPADAKSKFATAAPQLLPDAQVRAKASNGGGGGGVNARMTEGTPRHFTTPAKITAAVAVIGLGAGIAFGVSTRTKYDDCEQNAAACTGTEKDTIRRFGLAADAGFAVAIGATIATIVLYATSKEEPRMIVAPTAEGGATVSAFGRF